MRLAIVIYSNDAETVWNAFRFAVFSTIKGDFSEVFLLGKGVESVNIDSDKFHITEEMNKFVDAGGKIYSCGTCLKLREMDTTEICPISTLSDLHEIISKSDKVLTF